MKIGEGIKILLLIVLIIWAVFSSLDNIKDSAICEFKGGVYARPMFSFHFECLKR